MASLVIRNVYLAPREAHTSKENSQLWDVYCTDGMVDTVVTSMPGTRSTGAIEIDAQGQGILLPALCHAHIHLDKCHLLDQCDMLVEGDFKEALSVTAKAKERFPLNEDDVYARGRKLIIDSVECGVTAMRAHVEVDAIVQFTCLNAALRLKEDLKDICDVQISVFAQEPLYPSPTADINFTSDNNELLHRAAFCKGVSSIGSAPYVEPSLIQAKANMARVLRLAEIYHLHVDFHLDYARPSAESEPMIWDLLKLVHQHYTGNTVCVGHATLLTAFSPASWARYVEAISSLQPRVTLVGLPPSDLYMMGCTLNVAELKQRGVPAAMAVNNVGNAFGPRGSVDPLEVVGLAAVAGGKGTEEKWEALVESVSTGARAAIGMGKPGLGMFPRAGGPADFVLLLGNTSVREAALAPAYDRVTIKAGAVVARRRARRWVAGGRADEDPDGEAAPAPASGASCVLA